FGITAPFAETDAHRLDEMLALNVVALTRLTRALLPQLLRADRGVLVNVASAAAYQPTPGMAAYGATKAYVLSLTEAIAEETRWSG
ncbi:SDR family NAD(P)-dependent oxidoreductase, partial [Mycobacterium tuberculosis]|nr:SDR family NAD(P)-dependent oxidoreductase [Mycobacterium tuberculosis]